MKCAASIKTPILPCRLAVSRDIKLWNSRFAL
jgi:hypothetical protein